MNILMMPQAIDGGKITILIRMQIKRLVQNVQRTISVPNKKDNTVVYYYVYIHVTGQLKYGLDTIAYYLPSPSHPSNQIMSVVEDYQPKFIINLDMAASSAKSLDQRYDWIDVENTQAAKEFLMMASLETSLHCTVKKHKEEDKSFASLIITRVIKTLSSYPLSTLMMFKIYSVL